MGVRRIILVVVPALLGLAAATAPWVPLRGNRLSEGADRILPQAEPIHCGRTQMYDGTVKKIRSLHQSLTSYFGNYAFTAGAISSPQSPNPNVGRIAHFNIAEVKGSQYVYALQVASSGERGYWLDQGGSIDIPAHPGVNDPKYVFTPDFSGCSWTITPMRNGNLRLRHVEGTYEAAQFNNLPEHEKGGSVTYAMEYKDYGYLVETRRLVGNVPGFAYMYYSGGSWKLRFQRKTCASTLGGYVFKNNALSSAKMMDHPKSSYRSVSNTKEYVVP